MAEIVASLAEQAGAFVSRDCLGVSLDSLRQMALMGAGVAVLPSLYALAEAVRDADFVVRRIGHPEAVHEISLLWRRSAPAHDDYLRLSEHLIEVKHAIRQARPEKFGDRSAVGLIGRARGDDAAQRLNARWLPEGEKDERAAHALDLLKHSRRTLSRTGLRPTDCAG